MANHITGMFAASFEIESEHWLSNDREDVLLESVSPLVKSTKKNYQKYTVKIDKS